MAETLTANFGWTKPDPGGSANTWGSTLNATTDKIDAQVFANQQAMQAGSAPIGSGALWFSNTPPTGWLICNGAALATTGPYAALFAVIGYTYGGSGSTFNLPNMPGTFPFAAGGSGGVALAARGGASSATLSIAQLPSHAHPITDVAHNHGVNDPSHNHGLNQSPHAHGVSDPGHAHSYTLWQASGPFPANAGSPTYTMGSTGATTGGSGTGIGIQAADANISMNAAYAGVSLNASGSGLSTTNAVGSGVPINTMPPFLGVNFIIRYA